MMKQIKSKLTIRLLLALLLSLGIVSSQWALAPRGSAAVTLNLKSASQISSEANTYDTAVREISRIERLNLTTAENRITAQGILEKHVANLRFARSKMIALGLSDSSFVSSVKAKVFDTRSAEQFALELGQDANAIFKLSGASAARDRIRSKLSEDISKLTRVARLQKEAEAEMREAAKLPQIAPALAAVVVAVTLVSVAIVVAVYSAGALAPALAALAVAAAGVGAAAAAGAASAAAVAGAAAIVAGVEAIAGASADQAQDKIAACEDKADKKYKSCKSAAHDLFGPAVGIAVEACKADWVYEAAKCLATD